MQSISAACLSIVQAACGGVRVCKTRKRNAIHFGGIVVRGEDHANFGLDLHGIVIDQVALAHGPLVLVTVNHILEVCLGVDGRCGG
jgi:hypothetical protein